MQILHCFQLDKWWAIPGSWSFQWICQHKKQGKHFLLCFNTSDFFLCKKHHFSSSRDTLHACHCKVLCYLVMCKLSYLITEGCWCFSGGYRVLVHAQSLPSCKHVMCFSAGWCGRFSWNFRVFPYPFPFLLLTQKDRCLNVFIRGIITVLQGLLAIRVPHCPRMAPLVKALLIPRKPIVHFGFMQFLKGKLW